MTVDWTKPIETEKGWEAKYLCKINDTADRHAEYISVVTQPDGDQFISYNQISGAPFRDSDDPHIRNRRETCERWVVMYRECDPSCFRINVQTSMHTSESLARAQLKAKKGIAIKQVTITEGDGLWDEH